MKNIILKILLVIIVMFIVLINYAKFIYKSGEINDFEINNIDGLNVRFNDTSNISLINIKPSDSILKVFSVENTSHEIKYYSIKFVDITNNFKYKDDLIYSLKTYNNSVYVNDTILPDTVDKTIASKIKIQPGEKHGYELLIKYLDSSVGVEDNDIFSTSVKIVNEEKNVIDTNNSTLYNKIIHSEEVNSIIDDNKDGLYFTNNSINGYRVYFYRGSSNIKNNVVFADYCWKILRTTENDGIKLVYNGIYNIDKLTCENDSQILDDLVSFNSNNNYNSYVGFMYGTPSSKTYNKEHENITSSQIKNELEKFYKDNLLKYSDYILDDFYCNNRKTSKFTINNVFYDNLGYADSNTGYISMKDNLLNNNPSYNCYNKNDIFTVNNDIGNKSLTYPIGLLTLDEIIYSGYNINEKQSSSFLSTKNKYWTMSPAYYNGSNAYIYAFDGNYINAQVVDSKLGVRPVISVKNNILVQSGDGSKDLPYIIK